MATKIAAEGVHRTVWNPRNQKHLYRHFHFHRGGTMGFSNLKHFSSSTSSPLAPQVLMENLYYSAANTDSGDNNNDNNNDRCMITKITLNRPKVNAMGRQMISELEQCLDALTPDESSSSSDQRQSQSRCVVLSSCSDTVFSAGADLKERASMTHKETQGSVARFRQCLQRVAALPMPVIAAIDGVAVGGGLELALAADLRIASERALLWFPETSLGILPGAGGTQRLARLIGSSKAKEMIWTGRKVTGHEALSCGLVNEVVPNDRDEDITATVTATTRAVDLAFVIAANGPLAIRASKVAIDRGSELVRMDEALELERDCYERVVPTKDRLEGLEAFREGRTPLYKGE